MKKVKEAKVEVKNFTEITVTVKKDNSVYATDGCFSSSGVIGHDNNLVAVGDDITTNYLEVAMALVLRELGLKVNPIKPYPLNRKFEVKSIRNKVMFT